MTRALAVFHTGGVGGPQRSVWPILDWLAAHGGVDFIVPASGATEEMYSALGPVTVLEYSVLTYSRGIRRTARLARHLGRDVGMFRRELRRRQPDVVVTVSTVLPALLLAARLERVPCVVYAAELYGQQWKAAPLLRVWGALLSTVTAGLAAGIVCCSNAVARQYRRHGRLPVAVAYPPVGSDYAAGDRDTGRARIGLDAGDVCLLLVGSISRGRGQDVALRALPLIRRRFASARLVLVGDPHPRAVDIAFGEELRELTEQLGLAGAVVFAGSEPSVRGMADLYAAADVVVNPARLAEAFGRVGPEALVAGRPVVASELGGIPEAIRDAVDGLLVAPDDPAALAGAVSRLLDDPALAERLVRSGRRRVVETFSREENLAGWRRVLDPAVQRRRSR